MRLALSYERNNMKITKIAIFPVIFALHLQGCGGGDSSGVATPPPPSSYTVTASAGTGGIISPTSATVTHGQTTTFNLTLNDGYTITSVTGCGGTLNGTVYTSGAITAACAVSASFELKKYTVSATAGTGGTISPSSVTVTHGQTTTFNLTLNDGYSITSVTGCGGTLNGAVYTSGAITSACTVSASFELKKYTVAATAGTGGTISPTSVTVTHGQTARFDVSTNEGYILDSISGCNGTPAGLVYNTAPVFADCKIDAMFKQNSDFTAESRSSYGIANANAKNEPLLAELKNPPGVSATARAIADFDGDGLHDLFVAPSKWLEVDASIEVRFYRGNSKTGSFPFSAINPNWITGSIPKVNHGRKVILGDYNGDKVLDIFVCAHGYDAEPFPGTINHLLLSQSGTWASSQQSWSSDTGFSHGCASGEVRFNNSPDIFVADNKKIGPFWLRNQGNGVFVKTQAGLPASLSKPSNVFSSEILDIDGDGRLDLVTGGEEGTKNWHAKTSIFWGKGDGTFSDANSFTVPAVAGAPNVLSFVSLDVNGDGQNDLVVSRVPGVFGAADFYKGYILQILIREGRQFKDSTATFAADLNTSAKTAILMGGEPHWMETLWSYDVDGDSLKDLVSSQESLGIMWSRNLNGKFDVWKKLP
jgi:hypothetical protein